MYHGKDGKKMKEKHPLFAKFFPESHAIEGE
jgi:hypothetical protein